jgi:hypothetical protein
MFCILMDPVDRVHLRKMLSNTVIRSEDKIMDHQQRLHHKWKARAHVEYQIHISTQFPLIISLLHKMIG